MKKTQPIWKIIDEITKYCNGEMTYADIKRHVWTENPDIKDMTITCQIISCSVNHHSRVHYQENKKPRVCTSEHDFLYNTGRGRVVRYDPQKHGQWEIVEKNGELKVKLIEEGEIDTDLTLSDDESEQSGLFAYENHLRDFLAKNLPTIDKGKTKLTAFVSKDGRDGVEFQTDVGPIDILAKSGSGDFYVFELKLSQGPDKALGQILRYMGWVEKNLCEKNNKVFGIIVAADISLKLRYAASQVPSVRLMEYNLQVTLEPVQELSVATVK